jgi:Mg/Co/Ni transporter MgtE
MAAITISADELHEAWRLLSPEERLESFGFLSPEAAQDFFLDLRAADQLLIVRQSPPAIRRAWLRLLAPDDAADLLQEARLEERADLMALLDPTTRREVNALLAYEEDDAGGLMSPRYARLRPDMTVDEAIGYLRMQARQSVETIHYAYVLDPRQHLLGVLSLRELFTAPGDKRVADVMKTDLVTVAEDLDQEMISQLFSRHDLIAIPVLDAEGRMKGIVTVDDIVDVVEQEATEDIQKMGGSEALDAPYLQVGMLEMIRKRGGWLSALFLGELHPADHQQRRQLGLAGDDADHPRPGALRGAAARLVAGVPPRVRRRPRPGHDPGSARLHADPDLASGVRLLWRARSADRLHRGDEPRRRRPLGDPDRLLAPVRPAPARLRPRQRLGAVRRHAG